MPSRRHQLLTRVLPRVRRSRPITDVEAERARALRWQAGLPTGLPTRTVPFFGRRFALLTEVLPGGFPAYAVTRRGRSPRRTVVYLHGGGFVAPMSAVHVAYAARLATALDARVVLPAYPRAPAHTWRDSHEQLLDLTTRWAEASPDGVVLAGDSAGGGLALALAIGLRERGGPQATHLLLHSPWADLTSSAPETAAYGARDPWLIMENLDVYARWWAGSEEEVARPEVSPALAPLHDLPPALVFCGTLDSLLPGCRLLADRAAAAGWPLTYVEEPDLLHVYPILPTLPEARLAWRQTLDFLRPGGSAA